MDDNMIKVFIGLFTLYAGVMSWLFKTGWTDIQRLKQELAEMRTNCVRCQSGTLDSIRTLIDERFDKIEGIVERKVQAGLEAGFTQMELTWINSGQLQPKNSRKKTDKDA